MLLDLIRPSVDASTTILDIGSGIGVIDQELLRAGAAHAVLVEGSAAYLEVARDEPRRASLLDRLVLRLVNAWYRPRGRAYRAYAHPNARIDELAAAAGLRLWAETGTFVWRVALYERVAKPA